MAFSNSNRDGVLQWPRRIISSLSELRLALADAETRVAQRDAVIADLEARIAQRDRRLVELNHRFANSLQILSGSLRRDGGRMLHEDAKAALDAAATRTVSVARLHRKLAEHENDERLDLCLFLNDLAEELEDGTGLRCNVDGESIMVSGNVGFTLASVVTELVLNARKHAYDGMNGGTVNIGCHRVGSNQLRLSVADRGKGLPRDFRPESAHGIGMSLVVATAKQLKGELNVRNRDGACFTLLIPI